MDGAARFPRRSCSSRAPVAQPARSGAKRRHYVIALGSADEVGAALDAAQAQQLSTDVELDALRVEVVRCAALVGGLVRSATLRRR